MPSWLGFQEGYPGLQTIQRRESLRRVRLPERYRPTGGRLQSESVAGMLRNGWPPWAGMSGRFGPARAPIGTLGEMCLRGMRELRLAVDPTDHSTVLRNNLAGTCGMKNPRNLIPRPLRQLIFASHEFISNAVNAENTPLSSQLLNLLPERGHNVERVVPFRRFDKDIRITEIRGRLAHAAAAPSSREANFSNVPPCRPVSSYASRYSSLPSRAARTTARANRRLTRSPCVA